MERYLTYMLNANTERHVLYMCVHTYMYTKQVDYKPAQ